MYVRCVKGGAFQVVCKGLKLTLCYISVNIMLNTIRFSGYSR